MLAEFQKLLFIFSFGPIYFKGIEMEKGPNKVSNIPEITKSFYFSDQRSRIYGQLDIRTGAKFDTRHT